MKIENVQSIKNIPEKQQPQLLKRGEFFVSEVLEVRGETALLKSAQGTLLTARLLGDLWLTAGDHVETVVDEAQGSRYVLRLLDVSRGDGQAASEGVFNASANTAAQNVRTQILPGMLAMLKRNAGLEPKMAEFMARNGLPDSPENIETLARLVKGELKTGQALLDIQAEVVRTEIVLTNRSASSGQSGVFAADVVSPAAASQTSEAKPAAGSLITAGTAAAGAPALPTGISDAADINVAQPQRIEISQPDNVIQQNTEAPILSVNIENQKMHADLSALQSGVLEYDLPATLKTVHQNVLAGTNGIPSAILPDIPEPFLLASQLLSFVADLRDKKELPSQLKKAVEELPGHIKELKISLQTSDNNDRNTVARHAESLDRQLSLMSELKRFDCYHIPISGMNTEQTTAELYVFRQKRRKADTDPDNFAVLLGLDTQNMGRVETMIRASARSVTLEFRLEMAELMEAFEQGTKELEPHIAQAGFRLTDINVRELAARTTLLNAEEVQPKGQAPDMGSLDVRI